MKNKLIKIIPIFILGILLLTGCNLIKKIEAKEYSIEYYFEDEKLQMNPAKYTSGYKTLLPKLNKQDYEFVGWYTTPDFKGNKLDSISESSSKNYKLYAKMIPTKKTIDKIIEDMKSYKVSVIKADNLGQVTNKFQMEVENEKYKIIDETSISYIDNTKDNKISVVKDNKLYYRFLPTEKQSKDLHINYYVLFLQTLNDYKYHSSTNGGLILRDSYKDKVEYLKNIESFYIWKTSDDEFIRKIQISLTNGSFYALEYSEINDVTVTIPTALYKSQLKVSSVIVSPTEINVEKGVSLDKIKKQLMIKVMMSDGSYQGVPVSECSFDNTYDSTTYGSYPVYVTYKGKSASLKINVLINVDQIFVPADGSIAVISNTIDKMFVQGGVVHGVSRGIPSIGNPKILVVPVAFTDYLGDTNTKENIRKAFFGTEAETGWESLTTYYKKSSYGKLNIQGTVTDVWNCGMSSDDFKALEGEPTYKLIKDFTTQNDANIDFSEYDTDNDGHVDGIYFMYLAPIQKKGTGPFWAYVTQYQSSTKKHPDGVDIDFYAFIGYDFFLRKFTSMAPAALNAETVIHETGHMLGLIDYYDTDKTMGTSGGLGYADMMDGASGDHIPFSKMLLGWTKPRVLDLHIFNKQTTVTLSPYTNNGEVLLITKKWQKSCYDEYYLIDYYTPTNLYELEQNTTGVFGNPGIRILHIQAELNELNLASSVFRMTANDNGTSTDKLVTLVEADNDDGISNGHPASNSDLFYAGDNCNDLKWSDGTSVGLKINVNVITTSSATLVIKP